MPRAEKVSRAFSSCGSNTIAAERSGIRRWSEPSSRKTAMKVLTPRPSAGEAAIGLAATKLRRQGHVGIRVDVDLARQVLPEQRTIGFGHADAHQHLTRIEDAQERAVPVQLIARPAVGPSRRCCRSRRAPPFPTSGAWTRSFSRFARARSCAAFCRSRCNSRIRRAARSARSSSGWVRRRLSRRASAFAARIVFCRGFDVAEHRRLADLELRLGQIGLGLFALEPALFRVGRIVCLPLSDLVREVVVPPRSPVPD